MKNFLLSVFISLSVPYAAFASNISEITKGNEMVVPVSIPLHPEMSSVTILRKSEFLKTLNDESVTFIPTELKNGIEFETVVLDGKIYALFDDEQYLFLEENNEWGDGFMADLTCNTVGGATGIIVAAAVPGPAGVALAVLVASAASAACVQLQKTEPPAPSHGRNGGM